MYSLRNQKPEDYEFLRDLQHQSYRDVILLQFGDWDRKRQDELFEKNYNLNSPHQIIQYKNKDMGVLKIVEKADEIKIQELQILPKYQNMGIGSSILKNLIKQSYDSSKTLKLEVLRMNKAATLYQRLGFETYKITDKKFFMQKEK